MYPSVKVKIRVEGRPVAHKMDYVTFPSVTKSMRDPYNYTHNSSLCKAFFGKPGREKACFRCKCERKGFMFCR